MIRETTNQNRRPVNKYKRIIEAMILEYQNGNKEQSCLWHIIGQYLDEEADDEINERYEFALMYPKEV